MPFEVKEIIQVTPSDNSILSDKEFFCKITERLDEFNEMYGEKDPDFREFMRTYMMIPENNQNEWFIPIRVPGATRGHIKVVPYDGVWAVVSVRLYETTAVIGKSNIGCYKPGVEDILNEFVGLRIDFGKYNPMGGKKDGGR